MKKTLFITIAALSTTLFSAFGQGNFGLVFPQAESNLPKSKAPVPVCERKAFVMQPTHLEPTADGNLTLTGGWQMIEAATLVEKDITVWNTAVTDGWYNATVPGTVLTTLVEQQVYPDPYYGLNNLYIPETLCRQEWWYRISFPTPDIAEGELLSLLFNGINYKAEVWLNRKRLGNIAQTLAIEPHLGFVVDTVEEQREQLALCDVGCGERDTIPPLLTTQRLGYVEVVQSVIWVGIYLLLNQGGENSAGHGGIIPAVGNGGVPHRNILLYECRSLNHLPATGKRKIAVGGRLQMGRLHNKSLAFAYGNGSF